MNPFSDLRRRLARRVADAHAPLAPWLGLVSGSTVEDLADARSDVDMSLVFETLPTEAALRAACPAAWTWQIGDLADGSGVVAFALEGIEIQIGYSDRATLLRELDQVLVQHDPDTPLHKLCEGIAKAEPLCGPVALAALQVRIADYPAPLARALAAHWLGTKVTPWRAISQLVFRDALPWCRELQVQATMRLLGALAGLNHLYFTDFQFKRLHGFERKLVVRPPALAARLEAVLNTPAAEGFAELHALEGEVLVLVAARWPDLDLSAVQQRRQAFAARPA
jgi:hypothetical protein